MPPTTNNNPYQPVVTQPPKNRRFLLLVITLIVLLLVGGAINYLSRSTGFKFLGTTPSNRSLGLQTNVVLNFNKPISNGDEVIASLTTTPLVKMNVFVEGKTVTILPVDGWQATTYTVNIPKLTAGLASIQSFTTSFTPNPKAPGSNNKTAQDTEDIPVKQYPKLVNADQENTDYKISYDLDGDKVAFRILLLEGQDRDLTEEQAIAQLKAHNKAARQFIASLGVPKAKYTITYDDPTQEDLIYGSAGAPAN